MGGHSSGGLLRLYPSAMFLPPTIPHTEALHPHHPLTEKITLRGTQEPES